MTRIAIIAIAAALTLTASPASAAPVGLMGMATPPAAQTEADQHFILMKDTSKPGSANVDRFRAQREPPAVKPPKAEDLRKTGGIQASVLAPKPKPQ
jgi:hypothetical protein